MANPKQTGKDGYLLKRNGTDLVCKWPIYIHTTALLFLVALIACLSACSTVEKVEQEANFSSFTIVIGDVEHPQKLFSYEGYDTHSFSKDGEPRTAISLADVVHGAKPLSEQYTLLLIGQDGLTSEIQGGNLEGCHLLYTQEFGWELVNELHPVSSNIKLLNKIVVVEEGIEYAASFADATQTKQFTIGQLYKTGFTSQILEQGRSEINGRWVRVYTPRNIVPLHNLLQYNQTVAVFTKEGETVYDRPSEQSAVVLEQNSFSYRTSAGETVENITGILADPPTLSITEATSDVVALLEKDIPVLVIELDGWGWMLQQVAEEGGHTPFLSSLERQQALAAYPPVSTVGLAAIVTGERGNINGITSRSTKELKVEDIFAKALAMGKKSTYIEGNTNLIATSLQPILSSKNEEDSGVFQNTQQAIFDGADLIYAHFHSIDNQATSYGPYAPQTMEQVAKVDRMVQQLVESFAGKVIITADHGVHETLEGGTHGIVCPEDMLVPYIVTQGGITHE